jgi:hypothetical protein
VKQHDDIVSAIRYALMMLRYARLPPFLQDRRYPPGAAGGLSGRFMEV